FSTKSGNPELHSGLPCGVAQGFPAALTLSFVPVMSLLQCPRPSPPADASIRLPCSGPCDFGTYGGRKPAANLKILKTVFFSFHILSLVLWPVPCLPAF
ncbi:unnamed protein product, partial [Staurois parvus]